VKRLLLVAFFFEVGVVLIVIPWSVFWERNYFAQMAPAIGALTANYYFRGAVSGLGLINVVAGIADLVSLVLARSSERPASIKPTQFVED
jgi:hypothetical protein